MKEFDLDAAKRGEKVQLKIGDEWVDVYFVGLSFGGLPVVQKFTSRVTTSDPFMTNENHLRMAPKPPRTMWIQCYLDGHGELDCTKPCPTRQAAEIAANHRPLIGEPQEILVDDES